MNDLRHFFSDIYTAGLGRIREDGTIDERFKDLEKGNGSLYRQLVVALEEQEYIRTKGYDWGLPEKDILPAKECGFRTYSTQLSAEKQRPADYQIDNFNQLIDIFA